MPDLHSRQALRHPSKRTQSRRTLISLVLAIAAVIGFANVAAAPAMAATSSASGILPNDLTPKIAAANDSAPVELGVKFSPVRAGKVTAIQYYQGANAKDVTQATLWSSTGTALAHVTFAATDTVGWRTIPLSAPVALTAGQTYTASYYAPYGGYVATNDYFTSASTVGSLALSAGAGVYRYGDSGFPTRAYRDSNYLVDVVFSPSSTTPTPTPTSTPTKSPTPTPTPTKSPTPTATPTPSPSQGGSGATPSDDFPTAATAGLPSGWKPTQDVTGDYWIRTPGAVVQDLRVTSGTIFVAAPNVTLRRVSGVNASVTNYVNGTCSNGMTIEDSTFIANGKTTDSGDPMIGPGGYTVRNVQISGAPEGLRSGGKSLGCGPVTVDSTYIRIDAPVVCNDWHGDGIQGYDGDKLTVRNTSIAMNESATCHGTAPFFYPAGQGNTSIDVDGLLVQGAGYPFRDGMPGSVKNLNVVDKSWGYGPATVKCPVLTTWQASIVRLDSSGQPVTVSSLACTTNTDG